jgi:uncharacterized protein
MAKIKINVKVIVNSKQNKIFPNLYGDQLKIKIRAKPINGKANDYLIKYLSERLAVSKNDIRIVNGLFSAKKIIEITNMDYEDFYKRIRETQGEP